MKLISSLIKGDDHSGLLPPGTSLSIEKRNVRIIEKIGEGGFATVYSAKDNQRKYAVKHCKCQSTEQIELIDQEIAVMQKCATSNHRNIVSYFGTSRKVYEARDNMPRRVEYFILLEHMDNSLISYIKEHQQWNRVISEHTLFRLWLDIVRGLDVLHSLSPPIAHRDIKIDNVLISQNVDGKSITLKLCDFGSCVDGTPKVCETTKQINIESELIDRFTTPSYRSPEMIDLYQRKELSTKVDIWALGCVFFLLAYFEHPFPEGAKMSILDAKYKIPDKGRYSKKVSKLIKLCLHRDPTRRPTCKGIAQHLEDILGGGKGTLSSKKDKKRSNSQMVKATDQLKLAPKQNEADSRRKSHAEVQNSEEVKMSTVDEGWDPFDVDGGDDNIFDDNFDGTLSNASLQKSEGLQPGPHIAKHSQSQTLDPDDPFFSTDFASDFFGDSSGSKMTKPKFTKSVSNKAPELKTRKSGGKQKAIHAQEYQRGGSRKKKRDKMSRSRSKSPPFQGNILSAPQQSGPQRPLTPQPYSKKGHQGHGMMSKSQDMGAMDPLIIYGSQLAQLINMGFTEEQKNLKAIIRAKGNVQVAVNLLVSQ